jgi:CSLREA domain-containing protein
MKAKIVLFATFCAAALIMFGATAAQAESAASTGATINVNTTADELNSDSDCSLREAVRAANLDTAVDACPAGNGADTINIPAGSYTITISGTGEDDALTGDLDIAEDVTIIGAGTATTTVSQIVLDRIWEVQPGVTAIFTDMTVTNGAELTIGGGGILAHSGSEVSVTNAVIQGNSANSGGGIVTSGVMTVTRSVIADNSATSGGGGILLGAGGEITLIESTLSGNTTTSGGGAGINAFGAKITLIASTVSGNIESGVGGGGGIRIFGAAGSLIVINSTISGNSTAGFGGGIYAGNGAAISIFSTTISGNTASSGGGFAESAASADMQNTILANNTALNGSSHDCLGTIFSLGYLLIEDEFGSCSVTGTQTGLLMGLDPLLGPLQDNGGFTLTHALLSGSPARDAGNPAGCTGPNAALLTTDQRGSPRVLGASCDLGSYEALALIFLPIIIRQ